jgi:hypothetical protein
MNSLLQLTLDAHGGLERWRRFEHVSAHLRNGGVLWALKQQQGEIDDVNVRVAVRRACPLRRSTCAPQREGARRPDRCRHRDQGMESAGRAFSVSTEQPHNNPRADSDDRLMRVLMPGSLTG